MYKLAPNSAPKLHPPKQCKVDKALTHMMALSTPTFSLALSQLKVRCCLNFEHWRQEKEVFGASNPVLLTLAQDTKHPIKTLQRWQKSVRTSTMVPCAVML